MSTPTARLSGLHASPHTGPGFRRDGRFQGWGGGDTRGKHLNVWSDRVRNGSRAFLTAELSRPNAEGTKAAGHHWADAKCSLSQTCGRESWWHLRRDGHRRPRVSTQDGS